MNYRLFYTLDGQKLTFDFPTLAKASSYRYKVEAMGAKKTRVEEIKA